MVDERIYMKKIEKIGFYKLEKINRMKNILSNYFLLC